MYPITYIKQKPNKRRGKKRFQNQLSLKKAEVKVNNENELNSNNGNPNFHLTDKELFESKAKEEKKEILKNEESVLRESQ